MDRCPWCREQVEQLHPVPPEVVTRELVLEAGNVETLTDLNGCADCISAFMARDPVA